MRSWNNKELKLVCSFNPTILAAGKNMNFDVTKVSEKTLRFELWRLLTAIPNSLSCYLKKQYSFRDLKTNKLFVFCLYTNN